MKINFKTGSALLFVVALCVGCGAGCGNKPEPTSENIVQTPDPNRPVVILGRVPSGNPLDILDKMEPLISHLEDELGITIKPEFANSYAEFTKKMVDGEYYDVAFCAPFQYIAAHDKANYSAVLRPVRHGADTYIGVIITANPAITSLSQLKGKNIAFVDPNSTSGFLFPLGVLAENGLTLKDFRHQFLDGHDNVVLNVLSGSFDAGAVFEGAEKAYGKERASQLRVLPGGKTAAIYNEPIAMSPSFLKDQPELARRIIAAISNLENSERGRNALKVYGEGVNRFVEAVDSEYDTVRQYKERLPQEVVEGTGLN